MSYSIDLSGKVAVVTGSSRGLGRAIARSLADAGTKTVITSRTLKSLEPVQKEFEDSGHDVLSVELDVRSHESIQAMAKKALGHFGQVDILVNNAGMNVRKPATELAWEDWDAVLETNLKGAFFCSQALVPSMIERHWGRIINIGSATNILAYPNITAYCASRGGMLQMTKSLGAEWGHLGITVNVLAPGWFRTEQTRVLWENEEWMKSIADRIPNGRIGEPEEVGASAVFLASEDAAYVNGSLFMIDGAFTTGGQRSTVPMKKE